MKAWHAAQRNISTLPELSECTIAWSRFLKTCPLKDKSWFVEGLYKGFCLGCTPENLISAKRNMQSAYQHPKVISDYLKAEIELNSIVGPFNEPPLPNLNINRFGVIRKSILGKWRLITDLSYPQGFPRNFVA